MKRSSGSVTDAGSAARNSAMLRLPATMPSGTARDRLPVRSSSSAEAIWSPKFPAKAATSAAISPAGSLRIAGPTAAIRPTTTIAINRAEIPSTTVSPSGVGSRQTSPLIRKAAPVASAIMPSSRAAAIATGPNSPSPGMTHNTGMTVTGRRAVPTTSCRSAGAGSWPHRITRLGLPDIGAAAIISTSAVPSA